MKIVFERSNGGYLAYDEDTYEPNSSVMGGAGDSNTSHTGWGKTELFAAFMLLTELGLEVDPEYLEYWCGPPMSTSG